MAGVVKWVVVVAVMMVITCWCRTYYYHGSDSGYGSSSGRCDSGGGDSGSGSSSSRDNGYGSSSGSGSGTRSYNSIVVIYYLLPNDLGTNISQYLELFLE